MRLTGVRKFALLLAVCAASLASLTSSKLHAWQKYIRFDRVTTADGLPEQYVMSMAQDHFGYLWFGTAAGLARYDGHGLKIYRAHPEQAGALASASVISLLVDRDGTLWVGSDVGLSRFDRATETFTHYHPDPGDQNSLGGSVVKEIYEDDEGILWIGHWFGGITRFDRSSETFSHYRHDPEDDSSLPPGAVFEITSDSAGNIWVGTVNGERTADAAIFDPQSGDFSRIFTCATEQAGCPQPESPADHPENHFVGEIHEDDDGMIWLVGGELTRYDPALNTYRSYMHRFAPEVQTIGGLLEDGEKGFWLSDGYEGLIRFHPASGLVHKYHNDPADPTSIATSTLNGLFADREGRVWISSYDKGVSFFDPEVLAMGPYRYQDSDTSSVLGPSTIQDAAEEPTGHLWLIHATEARRISPDRQSVQVYAPVDDWQDGRCLGAFDSVRVHRSGAVWVSSNHGMCRYDPSSDRLLRFPEPGPEIRSPDDDPNDYGVITFTEDGEGYFWIETVLGMNRFDPETGEIVNFLPESITDQREIGDHLRARLFEDDGTVWFGSSTGLVKLDGPTGEISKFTHEPDNPHSISPGFVSDLERHDGFWVATATGLDRFDPATESFTPVTDANGDPLGLITGIVPDKAGHLWLGGARGLWRFDTQGGQLQRFGTADGVIEQRMEGGTWTSDGRLMFVGGNGLNIFDPATVSPHEWSGDVRVTNFLLANKPVHVTTDARPTPLATGIDLLEELELSWRDYLFAFEFAGLDYGRTNAIRYAYRLDGFDTQWIETDAAHRIATYTNVPSGRYDFRVRARTPQGEWNEGDRVIALTIVPPLWKTPWAWGLYLLVGVASVILLIRLRTATLHRRAAELQCAVDERTREVKENEARIRSLAEDLQQQLERNEHLIANISHEFRTPLTLILGPANRMLRRAERVENQELLQMIRRNSRRLLRLVDQLLGLSHLKASEEIPREAQSVNETVEAIRDSFGPVATERDLKIHAELEPDLWVSCTPDTLDNVVLNLVSNAVKNTPPGGTIVVRGASAGEGWVELSVSDTGVGIRPEDQGAVFDRFHRTDQASEHHPGSGLGLALVRELVTGHGGRVDLHSEPQQGTTVSLTLPRTAPPAEHPARAPGPATAERIALEVEAAAPRERPGEHPPMTQHRVESERPLVLVVEDNADMRRYLVELLATEYDCLVAENGDEAVAEAFEHVPDLVLCDVVLPGRDGFEVSHALKEDVRTSHVPIILLTARHDRDSRLEGWKEKVDGYLTKPFDDEELLARIANLLEVREILKSRFASRFFKDVEEANGMSQRDRMFMERLEAVLNEGYPDEVFGVEQMAAGVFMSTRQLQRKLKALTGQTPTAFLRSFRLRRARDLLRRGMAPTRVADAAGFTSPSYFSTCFKAQFGVTPSEYQDSSQESSATGR